MREVGPVQMTSSPESDPVLFDRRGSVAVITLNRPTALNAVNAALAADLGGALERAAADDSVRAIVVTGNGRAFSAGMDLKAFAQGEEVHAPGHPEWGFAGFTQHQIAKPVIAAVNGLALGGGAEIMLACDLVVASVEARIGLPEVTRGLFAAGGGVLRLPRQIPWRLAMEMILTGDPISASRAHELGLVNRVVAPDALLTEAFDLATRVAANAPLAVQVSKRLVHRSAAHADVWSPEVWELNEGARDEVTNSSDAAEGARAFAEKRAPLWTGH